MWYSANKRECVIEILRVQTSFIKAILIVYVQIQTFQNQIYNNQLFKPDSNPNIQIWFQTQFIN